MNKITLGKTNVKVSRISLGTWSYGKENTSNNSSVGWSGQKDINSKKALKKSYELGINHWDTADVYGDGHSEKVIGSMWTDVNRKDIFLATKFGWDKGPYNNWYNPRHFINNVERSLSNLKTDYIDLLYLHHCNFGKNDSSLDEAIRIIEKLQSDGKIKYIGLSDWSSKKVMKYIDKVKPDVVQIQHSVCDGDYIKSELSNYTKQNNIGVCFFSPIKHGLLTGKYSTPTTFPSGDFRQNVKEFKNLDYIRLVSKNKNYIENIFETIDQPILYALLGALLYDQPNACILLGQRNEEQVLKTLNLGHALKEKEALAVFELYKNLR